MLSEMALPLALCTLQWPVFGTVQDCLAFHTLTKMNLVWVELCFDGFILSLGTFLLDVCIGSIVYLWRAVQSVD